MELDLKQKDGVGLVIRWNGKIVTEIGPAGPVTTEEYERDVRRGRIAGNLAMILDGIVRMVGRIDLIPDHVNAKPNDKKAAYLRGFADGASGRSEPHRFPGVPPTTPEHSPSYIAGYSDGESVGRCIRMIADT